MTSSTTSTSALPHDVSLAYDIAEELDRALRSGEPVPPPSTTRSGLDVHLAYEVQQVNVRRALVRGDVPTGHKIGLTSLAMQRQLGVDQPDFGVLLGSMEISNGAVARQPLLQPRIEAEIAFLLGADLEGDDLGVDDVLAATAGVMPALEVIDSRIADWKISYVDTIADNASSGAYVLGQMVAVPGDLRAVTLTLSRDGDDIASGTGRAVLGHPAECVLWLARALRARGEVLRKGDVVLSGAVHAAAQVLPGQTFAARSEQIGDVSVSFPGGRT